MKNKRSLWLAEVAIALLVVSSLSTGAIASMSRFNEIRIKDLSALQLRHVASLIWYQELQKSALQKNKISFNSFNSAQRVQIPPFEFSLKVQNGMEHFSVNLVLVKHPERAQKSWKRQICALLTITNKGSISSPFTSERYLTLLKE